MTPRLVNATLTATLAFALATATASQVEAASVQSYAEQTSGEISGSNTGPITFTPVSIPSTILTPGSIILGSFVTNPLPSTATLTYNNTPFIIDLNVGNPSGFVASGGGYTNPNTYQYQISGVLKGSISGDGTTSMVATVNSITGVGSGLASTPPFPISDLVISPQAIAAPNGSTPGITTLTAQILVAGQPIPISSGPGSPAPTPEPSTIAIFGFALAGWACHRRSRTKRASA